MPVLKKISGMAGSGAIAYAARLWSSGKLGEVIDFNFPVPLTIIAEDASKAEDIAAAYEALAPLFPDTSVPVSVWLSGEVTEGVAALERLRRGGKIAIVSRTALNQKVPSLNSVEKSAWKISVGQKIERSKIVEGFVNAGYHRVDFVENPGEFAVRGAVIDFFHLEPPLPLRLYFEEDEIVSIRPFEVSTQTTEGFRDTVEIFPLTSADQVPFCEWLKDGSAWILGDGDFSGELDQFSCAFSLSEASSLAPDEFSFGAKANGPYRKGVADALGEMRRFLKDRYRTFFFSLNHGEEARVQELLEGQIPDGDCQFLIGALREGFEHPMLKVAFLSSGQIFNRRYLPSRWGYFRETSRGFGARQEIKEGEYVIHQDYGIARYLGFSPVRSPGYTTTDCLVLEFRGKDILYVPMSDFGKIQKYSSFEGHRPRLSSLDVKQWSKIKETVREGARELADQLLKVQAERQTLAGINFPSESAMEREFSEAFPYEETPDQTRAVEETLADMMSSHPMDRLIVGDVGFGKTEVAMRAAFKCVCGAKQVAVLVPTTILAEQHFRTFSARFAEYPVKIGMLTRFQTQKQQKETIEALASGRLDIVIGTIRILQKDIVFSDLGLTIIDEEHRFGVKDKEKLKTIRKSVDCLALSATPIPRSLNQAFSGLRSLSLIESAPAGRRPIVTKVGPFNEPIIRAAIDEEMARGGQIYYVHNRVRSIKACADSIERLVPGCRVTFVHGQMPSAQIEQVMWDFFNKRFDVLVASTIIESGLDVPSVNTLLIENAHEFGLAQLYQLRGRVGRESQQAYCYLFVPEEAESLEELTPESRSRITALKDFAQLGAGLKLAMRDLQIRGAGELLGKRQHGFVKAVGIEFYSQLLSEELEKRRHPSKMAQEPDPIRIDLGLSAYIPEDYLPSASQRLDFYKRILRSKFEETQTLQKEIENLCGAAPQAVRNLFLLLKIRACAQKTSISAVVQKKDVLEITFKKGADISPQQLSLWVKKYGDQINFLSSIDGDGLNVSMKDVPVLLWLKDFFNTFESFKNDRILTEFE